MSYCNNFVIKPFLFHFTDVAGLLKTFLNFIWQYPDYQKHYFSTTFSNLLLLVGGGLSLLLL